MKDGLFNVADSDAARKSVGLPPAEVRYDLEHSTVAALHNGDEWPAIDHGLVILVRGWLGRRFPELRLAECYQLEARLDSAIAERLELGRKTTCGGYV